ncbi:MAG: hypothetical protein ACFCUN_03385 [Hyphomicrobiaceae bacterium]
MIVSAAILAVVTLLTAVYAARRYPGANDEAARFTQREGLRLAIRLPFALVAAYCLAVLLPSAWVGRAIGAESGVLGVLIAAFAGGLLPGGPMVSFPLALALAGQGAGTAQLVALISGWSVFAIHRVISYESPLLGWRFVSVRLLASLVVPILAGLGALVLVSVTGEIPLAGR